MNIQILTLFPELFSSFLATSIIKRAQEKGALSVEVHNLRDWTSDTHHTVDDRPYGGGAGMILMVEPIALALQKLQKKGGAHVALLSPQGPTFTQAKANELTKHKDLLLICGRYEGVDERVRENLVDEEISIGDYVLSGGEVPAMVVIDTITRLLPGVLNKEEATRLESFQPEKEGGKDLLLEYPQYTRPEKYLEWSVPEVLLSGNHAEVDKWRQEKSQEKTKRMRPDLLR